jgi:hypothetical protein
MVQIVHFTQDELLCDKRFGPLVIEAIRQWRANHEKYTLAQYVAEVKNGYYF